jgi:ABC-type transport system involved in multi-copper enzyme maturation permease subunit
MLPSFDQFLPCLLLSAAQFLLALPWLWAVDSRLFKNLFTKAAGLATYFGLMLGMALAALLFLSFQKGSTSLELYGRMYGSVLHLQIMVDVLIIGVQLLLLVWPKGGAVALAALREGLRQPMFWLILVGAIVVLGIATIIPYFTFGDDYKMMKQICFDTAMLSAVLFGVLLASISINEEIEGRTAITLMSKPVTRRQFLLGKFLGIFLAAATLALVIGWVMNWSLYIQPSLPGNRLDEVVDPMPVQATALLSPKLTALGKGDSAVFLRGVSLWLGDATANGLGLVLGLGQVMVLLAIAATLATRLPMAANLVLCLVMFFLGNLAPVLRRASDEWKSQSNNNPAVNLISFLARVLETLTPTLEFFNMGPAIIRDTPIDVGVFARYVGSVFVYALFYTTIALLFGLILFEDRDLA